MAYLLYSGQTSQPSPELSDGVTSPVWVGVIYCGTIVNARCHKPHPAGKLVSIDMETTHGDSVITWKAAAACIVYMLGPENERAPHHERSELEYVAIASCYFLWKNLSTPGLWQLVPDLM